jgi:hypothetical protein
MTLTRRVHFFLLKFIQESFKMKAEGSHDRIHELLSNLLICVHSYTSKKYYLYRTLQSAVYIIEGTGQSLKKSKFPEIFN